MSTDMQDAPGTVLSQPHNVHAEQAALGAMLMSKTALAEVSEVLVTDDFYRPAHQLVYDAIIDLFGAGSVVDPITVAQALTSRGLIGRVGGAPYLHTLISVVPTTADGVTYARIVQDLAVRRRLLEAGTRIVQMAQSSAEETADLVARAETAVHEVGGRARTQDYSVLEDLLAPALDEIEAIGSRGTEMSGVPTGYTDLDELTNGLHPGQLVIIAARPAIGKSTAGLDIARACSIGHDLTSAIFSLEMSKLEITMRLLSAEAKVPLHHMRAGKLDNDHWARMAKRQIEIAHAPLYVDDSPNLTMADIRAKARRLKEQQDLRLVVVDYLQLMKGNGKTENRQQEVSELSRNLKLLAKELEVPVIAMSQLNRGPEQRTDKKPMMSDLRESGSIEQDADLVILMDRPDAYDKESPRAGEADFIVAKHRNGPTATITLAFQGHFSRFVDMPYS